MKRLPRGFYYYEKRQQYKLSFTFEGVRHSVYGRTQAECESKKDERLERLKNRMHIDNQKITLEKFYSLWIEEQAQEVKPSTIYNYEKSWMHVKKYLGKRQISTMTKADVLQMQNVMKNESSADTINSATRLLKQILNSAVNDRIINFNPCNGIKKLKTDRPKATVTNHRALTETETKMFLDNSTDSHYKNLFRFLLLTGCRIGEATALTWFDVNFNKKEININKTVSRTSNRAFEISNTPKTGSSNRTVPLTDELNAILLEQKENNSLLFGSRCIFVFPNARGTMANYNGVNNCIRSIVHCINHPKEKGENGKMQPRRTSLNLIQPFTVHAFRDTFATRCIEQGMQPNTLKALLGHSSLKMTMDLYAHVMPNTKHEELSKIRFAV